MYFCALNYSATMKKLILLLLICLCVPLAASITHDNDIRIQHFGESDGFSEALVQHMIQDRQGYIWLATWDGLRRYDGYRFETFKTRPGDNCPLETNRFSYLAEDGNGNIICRSNEKSYLFNTQSHRFEIYNKKVKTKVYHASEAVKKLVAQIKDYENIEVRILLTDRQQGIWTYTHRGLERLSQTSQTARTQKIAQQGEEVVSALLTDRQNQLWAADKNGYIRISRKGTPMRWLATDGTLHTTPVCFGNAAYCLYEDSKGIVWIGAKPGGLFRLTPANGRFIVKRFVPDEYDAYSINNESVYDIAEDTEHRLIIATFGGGMNIGIQQTDGSMRFVHCGNQLKIYPKDGLLSRCVWLLSDGTALLGTNDGLYTVSLNEPYEKMHFYVNRRQPDRASSLSNNYVMEILQTRKGEFFLATSGGGTEKILSRKLLSDTIRFQHYSVSEGIASDMNQTLAEDRDGSLWIVSAGSLSLLNTSTGVATNYWRLLSDAGEVFTEATPALLSDSSMVLGTTQGTLTLHPQQMAKSRFVPKIVFDCEKEIRLSPDERDINIRFAALDYNKNEEIVYAYRMEGIDQKWRYTRNNEINYASLAPGTYTLHVKSTNGDGVWVDNEETIVLHRAAHFNETPWAWMLYGLLTALLIFIVGATVKYIRMLQRELKDTRLTSKEQIELLGAQLKQLLPITEDVKEIHEEDGQLSHEDRQFANRLKDFVTKNIDNASLSVMDMAQAMNVSRTVLFVRMKHIFDSSPNNYLLNTRINYAKRLLSESSTRVSDVAYRCGFSDPKYFSRCFKKLTGMLPKEYVESIKKDDL